MQCFRRTAGLTTRPRPPSARAWCVSTGCGIVRADARPNWTERPAVPSFGRLRVAEIDLHVAPAIDRAGKRREHRLGR
jgi:hypothetical protein